MSRFKHIGRILGTILRTHGDDFLTTSSTTRSLFTRSILSQDHKDISKYIPDTPCGPFGRPVPPPILPIAAQRNEEDFFTLVDYLSQLDRPDLYLDVLAEVNLLNINPKRELYEQMIMSALHGPHRPGYNQQSFSSENMPSVGHPKQREEFQRRVDYAVGIFRHMMAKCMLPSEEVFQEFLQAANAANNPDLVVRLQHLAEVAGLRIDRSPILAALTLYAQRGDIERFEYTLNIMKEKDLVYRGYDEAIATRRMKVLFCNFRDKFFSVGKFKPGLEIYAPMRDEVADKILGILEEGRNVTMTAQQKEEEEGEQRGGRGGYRDHQEEDDDQDGSDNDYDRRRRRPMQGNLSVRSYQYALSILNSLEVPPPVLDKVIELMREDGVKPNAYLYETLLGMKIKTCYKDKQLHSSLTEDGSGGGSSSAAEAARQKANMEEMVGEEVRKERIISAKLGLPGHWFDNEEMEQFRQDRIKYTAMHRKNKLKRAEVVDVDGWRDCLNLFQDAMNEQALTKNLAGALLALSLKLANTDAIDTEECLAVARASLDIMNSARGYLNKDMWKQVDRVIQEALYVDSHDIVDAIWGSFFSRTVINSQCHPAVALRYMFSVLQRDEPDYERALEVAEFVVKNPSKRAHNRGGGGGYLNAAEINNNKWEAKVAKSYKKVIKEYLDLHRLESSQGSGSQSATAVASAMEEP
jgi:hypothetical protein